MIRLRWSPAAADDLESINNYLREHHPSLAQSTTRGLYDAARALKQFPNRGRIGRIEGTRELPTVPLPYVVVYSVDRDVVNVLRLIHASRDWPPKNQE